MKKIVFSLAIALALITGTVLATQVVTGEPAAYACAENCD